MQIENWDEYLGGSLEVLDLSYNQLSSISYQQLVALSQLEMLLLSHNHLTTLSVSLKLSPLPLAFRIDGESYHRRIGWGACLPMMLLGL